MVFRSSEADSLLVFAVEVDVNWVKVQMECQSSWMGMPVHMQCIRLSGIDVRKFGVLGSVPSFAVAKEYYLCKKSDVTFF